MFYGSLCLASPAEGAALRPFPQFEDPYVFKHTHHPQRGLLEIQGEWYPLREVHLPQRSKSFWVVTTTPDQEWEHHVNDYLVENLPHLESQFEFSRQLYKFNQYQQELKQQPYAKQWVSQVVNNGEHAHVGILSQWSDVYLFGVYDTVNKSVRIVWTDDEYFVTDVRNADYSRYVFYRYPVLQDRPLFLYTQALCSKWLGWTKKFQGPDGVLKAFNSLEMYLYKEPELPTLKPDYGSNT